MKEYKYGNATVRIHSPLLDMTDEESEKWVKEEKAKGNPILKELSRVLNECYRERMFNEAEK